MRVLVADDEAIERNLLRKKIEKFFGDAVEVLCARNGREVLALYAQHRPEVLILDIEMPGITGLEAARIIREEGGDCCILFLTAYDEFSYAKQAITVRAIDYLLKPCADEDLISAVEEALRIAFGRGQGATAAAPSSAPDTAKDEKTSTAEAAVDLREFIRDFIAEHYMEDIAVQDVAGRIGYSDVYFCKIFKQYFGQSFVSFLTDYRIAIARQRLLESGANVRQVGRSVGYADANYFAKVFRRVTGVSPSDYRASVARDGTE